MLPHSLDSLKVIQTRTVFGGSSSCSFTYGFTDCFPWCRLLLWHTHLVMYRLLDVNSPLNYRHNTFTVATMIYCPVRTRHLYGVCTPFSTLSTSLWLMLLIISLKTCKSKSICTVDTGDSCSAIKVRVHSWALAVIPSRINTPIWQERCCVCACNRGIFGLQ